MVGNYHFLALCEEIKYPICIPLPSPILKLLKKKRGRAGRKK
jgi:hypothetical protein